MSEMCFIRWFAHCRRSESLAHRLGGEMHFVHTLKRASVLTAPWRYTVQTVKTLRVLWRRKPSVVFVAIPPVFAAAVVWLYCALCDARMLIDAHSGTFYNPRWRWLLPLVRVLARKADATIVTNETLAAEVTRWRAHAEIVAEVPLVFTESEPFATPHARVIVYVCTFAEDEPVRAVLSAARLIPEAHIYITGPCRERTSEWMRQLPSNVTLTGFLPDPSYVGLLEAADAVLTLTTSDNTLQRAGYEAMSLGKPLVTSDWPFLKTRFPEGAVFVTNDAESIAAGIGKALGNKERYRREMKALGNRRRAEWAAVEKRLQKFLGGLTPAAIDASTQSKGGKAQHES